MKAPLRRLGARLVPALMALAAPAAHALCVQPLCTCSVSTSALAFGNVNPLSPSAVDSSADVRVSCGGVAGLLIPYQVALSAGGGSYASRRMSSGASTMAYNLYLDASRTIVWGDGTGGTQTVGGGFLLDALGLAPAQTWTVRGRIPGGQTTLRPGTYADTITVTVTYN